MRAVCDGLEQKLIEDFGYKPAAQTAQLEKMAKDAARNKAIGPLVLFQKWLAFTPDAVEILKGLGISWS